MRLRVVLLGALGGGLGLLAESAAYGLGDVGHWIPDLIVGWTFIAGGLLGWWRRPGSGTGPLLAATGYAWFLGNFHGGLFGPIALFALHRGPLIHCVLSFPRWRLSSRLDQVTVAAGYVAASVTLVAVSNPATMVLGVLVIGAGVRAAFVSTGSVRRARAAVLPPAAGVGLLLVGESAAGPAVQAELRRRRRTRPLPRTPPPARTTDRPPRSRTTSNARSPRPSRERVRGCAREREQQARLLRIRRLAQASFRRLPPAHRGRCPPAG